MSNEAEGKGNSTAAGRQEEGAAVVEAGNGSPAVTATEKLATAAPVKAPAARRRGEFTLVLGGKVRKFRITPAAAARFEKAAGKPFGEFNVQSVSDLADFLEAAEARQEFIGLGFDPTIMLARLRPHGLGGSAEPRVLNLIPLEERELLRVQYIVLAALAEIRGKPLPESLTNEVQRELGEIPSLNAEANGTAAGRQAEEAGESGAE